jgi:hypothetical protein
MEYLTFLKWCYKPPPVHLSQTMAQVAFMAKARQTRAKFDISKAILLDSGCSQHTFFSKEYFTQLKLYGARDRVSNITGVGDTILQPIGVGTVTITCEVDGEETPMILHNVLYCPQLKANLISCSQLLDYNVLISLRKKGCTIALDGQVVAQARHEFGLFILNTWEDYQEAIQLYGMAAYGTSNSAIEQLWHRRMGHLGIQNLRKLQKMSLGLDLSHIKQVDCVCEACLKGRMHDIPHRNSLAVNAKPYEVIFSDVEGPISTGYDGSRYFVTFTDACTKESELYCLKYRSEVPGMFRQYKALKERPYEGLQIRRFHSDGGGEYLGYDFQFALAEEGTTFSYSVPETQQANGIAERMNRTLKEKAQSDIAACGLDWKYWPLAIKHANYLRNRSPAAGIDTTPDEAATGKTTSLEHCKPFGCLVWYRAGSQKNFRTFVDDHTAPGSFVGFDSPHIIRILSDKGKVIRAAAVHFQEYHTIRDVGKDNRLRVPSIDDSDLPFYSEIHRPHSTDSSIPMDLEPKEPTSPQNSLIRKRGRPRKTLAPDTPTVQPSQSSSPQTDTPRRSGRLQRRNVRALMGHQFHRQHQFSTAAHASVNIRNQLASENQHALLSKLNEKLPTVNRFCLLAEASPSEPYEPQSWKGAMGQQDSAKWLQAAKEEFASLIDNNTWDLVEPPHHQKVLPGKWVFKYKRGISGKILRYKARWVAKGYEQQFGIDYDQTFASVVKPMSYKALFAIAASLDLEIEQMDVKTAFLYGLVEEDIYVQQPTGLGDNSGRVCKLNKALYGLKQSPRVWYKTLSDFLVSKGFKAIDADNSVFQRDTSYIAVYVDDLLLIGPDSIVLHEIKLELANRFSMTDLGPVAFYLGMSITRDRQNRTLRIGQQAYLSEAIRNAGVWDAICATTPMESTRLEPAEDGYFAEPGFKALYQSHVGTLMYAMLGSRPDIAFSVSCVSRYASNPTPKHMIAVLRIFKYLHGTLTHQLTYRGELSALSGYSDSDWAGDVSTSRSTSGFVFNIGSGAISWSAKRQPTVALSTCEAEYRGQTQAAKEAIWLRQLLQNLNPSSTTPYATIIYCDNQGAIALAKDPRFHARTKHIAIQHHWVREQIANETIQLEYVSTAKQVADGLTKALPKAPFEAFRDALGLEAC